MKLYSFAGAPNPRRVTKFMAEKGIDIPTEEIDIRNGAHLQPDYLKINAKGEVPTLELDDGTIISESVAICIYLEEMYPEPPLLGRNAVEKAQVMMWERRIEMHGLAAIAETFRNSTPGFKDHAVTGTTPFAQLPELAERGRKRAEIFFEDINLRLADSEWVAGPSFSLPDMTLDIGIGFAAWAKLGPTDAHTHIKRWQAQMAERPSAKV